MRPRKRLLQLLKLEARECGPVPPLFPLWREFISVVAVRGAGRGAGRGALRSGEIGRRSGGIVLWGLGHTHAKFRLEFLSVVI